MSYKRRERDAKEILNRCGKKAYRKVKYGFMRRGTWQDHANGYSKGPVHLSEYTRGSHKLFTKSLCGASGRREWNPRKTTCHRCRHGGSFIQRLEREIIAQYESDVL